MEIGGLHVYMESQALITITIVIIVSKTSWWVESKPWWMSDRKGKQTVLVWCFVGRRKRELGGGLSSGDKRKRDRDRGGLPL